MGTVPHKPLPFFLTLYHGTKCPRPVDKPPSCEMVNTCTTTVHLSTVLLVLTSLGTNITVSPSTRCPHWPRCNPCTPGIPPSPVPIFLLKHPHPMSQSSNSPPTSRESTYAPSHSEAEGYRDPTSTKPLQAPESEDRDLGAARLRTPEATPPLTNFIHMSRNTHQFCRPRRMRVMRQHYPC